MMRYYVVAIPSNDERPEAGDKHAQRVARALHHDFADAIVCAAPSDPSWFGPLRFIEFDPIVHDGHAPASHEPGHLSMPMTIWYALADDQRRELFEKFGPVTVTSDG